MRLMFIRQIKTRLTLQGVMVSVIIALSILCRFAYVIYNGDNDVKGDFFGFSWLSSFLYSFGIELAFILVGIGINYSTAFMERSAIRPFKFFGWCVQGVGFYFLFWIFLDDSIFTETVEMLFSGVFSFLAVWIQIIISKFFANHFSLLKSKIRFVMDRVVLDAPHYVKDEDKWNDDIIEPTLDKLNE